MMLSPDWVGSCRSLRWLSMRQKHSTWFRSSRATGTILLVDSDEDTLNSLATSLTDAGFMVYGAANAQAALGISREYAGEIDVFVSDAQLPVGDETAASMTGIELARQVHAQRPTTKIVLMSEINLESMVRGQGWEFIHGPFSSDALKQKIEESLATGVLTPRSDRYIL
jgi:DNA-binding NtrC family response regulator